MNKSMTDAAPSAWTKGVAVTPTDQLLTWLDAQKRDGEALLIKVPVVVGKGFGPGFDISNSKIGELEVVLDDTALGVGVADKAMSFCRGKDSCAMWLEGYWKGKGAPGAFNPNDYEFKVTKIVEQIADLASANETFVETAGPNAN